MAIKDMIKEAMDAPLRDDFNELLNGLLSFVKMVFVLIAKGLWFSIAGIRSLYIKDVKKKTGRIVSVTTVKKTVKTEEEK
jgi:hypothetical protein